MTIVFIAFWAFIGFVAVFFVIGDALTRIVIGWRRVDRE